MSKTMKFLCFGVALTAAVSLSACHRDNPMMQEQMIDTMKGRLFLNDDSNFPIRHCARFYAGMGEKSWQTKCEQWTASYYKSMLDLGELPHTTTLEQFRSADFWKAVIAKQ